MAYWIEGRHNGIRSYACDYLSDILKLPTQTKNGEGDGLTQDERQMCAEGARCVCLEDGSQWRLGKESGWTKVGATSSGGGSGGSGEETADEVIYF